MNWSPPEQERYCTTSFRSAPPLLFFSCAPRPPNRQHDGIARIEAFAGGFVEAFEGAGGNGKCRPARGGLVDHVAQIIADAVDVERDRAGILALQRGGDHRPAPFEH